MVLVSIREGGDTNYDVSVEIFFQNPLCACVLLYTSCMAVVTEKAIFFHIAKTGGSWVRKALDASGISYVEMPCKKCGLHAEYLEACCGHANPKQLIYPQDGKTRFLFTFVRHPLAMYQSYWAYKMREAWTPKNHFDAQVQSDNFHDFVRAALDKYPQWLTKWFLEYTGPEDSPYVHFIGRQENLREDLIQALRLAGEKVNEQVIRALKPDNVAASSEEWRERCSYTPELQEAVLKTEDAIIQRFYAGGVYENGV